MKPYYSEDGVTIYSRDCRRLMGQLEPDSIDCCVTSPPYWGLRDYGIEPSVWGEGDDPTKCAGPGCEHEWGEWVESHNEREATEHAKSRTTDRFYGDESRRFNGNHQKHTAGAFCCHCGAWKGCLGLEPTPQLYLEHLVGIFEQVRRVLKPEGVCFLNIGDSYTQSGGTGAQGQTGQRASRTHTTDGRLKQKVVGLKPKDLCLIPFRLAIALQEAGWYVRSDIIWSKPNPMPESVKDRPTRAHEYVLLLSKSERYYFHQDAVRVPLAPASRPRAFRARSGGKYNGKSDHEVSGAMKGRNYGPGGDPDKIAPEAGRNIRSVWNIPTQSFPEAHFAVFPEKLAETCIKAGCPEGGTVLDPFTGAGTVALVARRLGCRFVGAEMSAEYCEIAVKRLRQGVLPFSAEPREAG